MEFWREFLEIYRSKPELWQVSNPLYKNRKYKQAAYVLLLEKLQEQNPNATIETVKKKINSYRASYRRELKKMKESEITAETADDLYVSNLWYIPYLDFLRNEPTDDEPTIHETIKTEHRSAHTEPLNKYKKLLLQKKRSQMLMKAAKRSRCDTKRLDSELRNVDSETKNSHQCDEASVLANGWAALYRKLRPRQQLYACRTISEVLFKGAFGELEANSYRLLDREVPIISQSEDSNLDDNEFFFPPTINNSQDVLSRKREHQQPIEDANFELVE